jgi:hypothetical protein
VELQLQVDVVVEDLVVHMITIIHTTMVKVVVVLKSLKKKSKAVDVVVEDTVANEKSCIYFPRARKSIYRNG